MFKVNKLKNTKMAVSPELCLLQNVKSKNDIRCRAFDLSVSPLFHSQPEGDI